MKPKPLSIPPDGLYGALLSSRLVNFTKCCVVMSAILLGFILIFMSSKTYSWTGELLLEADREVAQPGEQIQVSFRVRLTLEAGETLVGLDGISAPIQLNGLRLVRLINPLTVGNSVDLLDPQRPVLTFTDVASNPRGLLLQCTGTAGTVCDTEVFEIMLVAVSSTATGGSTVSLQLIQSTTSRQLEIQALSQIRASNMVSPNPSVPPPLGDPIVISVVELEAGLILRQPITPGVLGTVDNIDEPNAVHVLNVQLVDGDGAGNGDSFPSPVVSSFTIVADVSMDAFTFELRNSSNTVLATGVGKASGAVRFNGLNWQVPDGQASPVFAVYAYKSGPDSNLSDGQQIIFSIGNTPSSVLVETTITFTSRLSGMSSDAAFSIDVQAAQVVIGGSGTWDLSAPYVLLSTATDTDGNVDSGFTFTGTQTAELTAFLGDSTTGTIVAIDALSLVPVSLYTDVADTDREYLEFQARIGMSELSTHAVVVDVMADQLVLASPVTPNPLESGVSSSVMGFVVHAVSMPSLVIDSDENDPVGSSDPNVKSLLCEGSGFDPDATCESVGDLGSFDRGVYTGPLVVVTTLTQITVAGEITTMLLYFGDPYGYFNLLDEPISVIGCTGDGLTLDARASDESFFDITVGGMLCQGAVDYDIYYYDTEELGGNCGAVQADALVSSATAAAQVESVELSTGNSAVTVSNVSPDTRYCVVAQVNGLTAFSPVIEVNTIVEATTLELLGAAEWDLDGPYALSATGTFDAQGRRDSNFSLSDAIVEARVGDDAQPWVPATLLQPVGSTATAYVSTASYTADRDGVPFALRARIGSGLNSTLSITVDVDADNIVSTVFDAVILAGVSNPVDLFELRAVKDTVLDTDVDVEVDVICATGPLPGIESCTVDSAPERFIAGVYSGVVAATVLLENAVSSTEVTLFADVATGVSFVAERFEYSLTVLSCSGKGLTLQPGASDESFFEVAVGGMLCEGTVNYNIYYFDALELGGDCSSPMLLADALISSATAAAQVQRAALSVGNSTATISNVIPDTRYCVVAQASGSTASSSVTEVNTIVIATRVEISGPPVWDLTVPYMLRSTGTDNQGRLDGNFSLADVGVTVEARLGDDAQSWVPVSTPVQAIGSTARVPTATYTADTDGVAFALRARIGVGQNSTLNLSVDVAAVTLIAVGDNEAVPVDIRVAMVTQVVNAVDVNGVIDGDYAGTLVVQHDADGSVGLPVLSTVTVVVIEGSFIAGISTSVLRVEVEADMPGNQPAVISLLLGARDSLGQELMPTAVSFELLLAYDFDFDADGVLDDEDAGILFLWFNNRRLAALGTPEFLLRPAIRAPRNWISADMAPAVIVRLQRALVTDDVSGDYRFDALDFDASGVLDFEDAAILSLWFRGRGSLGTAQQILARAISLGWTEAPEADAVLARLQAVLP